jgi:hypothetical protein
MVGRNPGAKTQQLLYDLPKLPATETAKQTRLANTNDIENYPSSSQPTVSQDRCRDPPDMDLNRNLNLNNRNLDTIRHARAYLPPLATVNSRSEGRLFLDTRPSSPTLSDSDAYAPSGATASVYTTHTHTHTHTHAQQQQQQFQFQSPPARPRPPSRDDGTGMRTMRMSDLAYSTTDSLLLSPATVVGNAMLAEWDADAGGSPAPRIAPALPLPVSSAHGGGTVSGVRGRTHMQMQNVPSLPPVGQPSLRQLALMHEMPDYRSPTYSIFGMYSGTGSGPAADTGASASADTGRSAYGGLATLAGGGMGSRSGGAVPGTGLFGRIL